MNHRLSIPTMITVLMIVSSCSSQETTKEITGRASDKHGLAELTKKEPHRYGGWHCPDNFGFAPVDVQKLNEVPAISNRLPNEQELQDHMSLIKVDTVKYPDARALKMDLPRVARIKAEWKNMNELIIVIQAIVVSEDTVVGYRFPNGGNGSARIGEVSFLSKEEVEELGSQPFFYSTSVLKASKEDIWRAITKSEYGRELGEKFNQQEFFASEWTPESMARLRLDSDKEKALGYVSTVFGNAYLQIDYLRDGFHYSEKMLMIEHQEDNTTELFFACGPFPKDFEKQKSRWENWITSIVKASEGE